MIQKITGDQRAILHRFLQEHFNLIELKDLAFELGVDYELLQHGTKTELSRELVGYFERRSTLNCLVERIMSLRDGTELVGLLAQLAPCVSRSKVQIILRGTRVDLSSDLLARLAEEVGANRDEVELIKGVQGTVHLLISVPSEASVRLIQGSSNLHKQFTPTSFELLSELSRITWQTLSVYLPLSKLELLNMDFRWRDAVWLIRESKQRLYRERADLAERAAYHYYAGAILLFMHRWAAAIDSFNEVLAWAPTLAMAFLNRGVAYEAVGRNDEALRDYDQALNLDPTLVEAYVCRGATYVQRGELRNALNDFERAIKLNPRFAGSYLNHGGVLSRLRRHEEALNDFNRAIRLAADDKRAYFGRALTLAKLHRDKDAIRDFTRMIELDSSDARGYLDRGIIYERMRLFEEALADFERARELGDTRAEELVEDVREKLHDAPSVRARARSKASSEAGELHIEEVSPTAGYEQELDEIERWEN